LLPDLPEGVTKVWTLAAYPSYHAFQDEFKTVATTQKLNEDLPTPEKLNFIVGSGMVMPIFFDRYGDPQGELLSIKYTGIQV
jgi:hypothetical protein